uniref:Uncharacterized protein n=1 Tax=Chlamydomonas leiostraca TaxID=1034604 RepID=A0A7S0S597_9CHLO|mmetsp:Transcript_9439/g.23384  ORF Transcript_9439/g.23384 Transcript_9439/m.23384 type:complete len:285 (+) Transcript_9439:181-1035(+)
MAPWVRTVFVVTDHQRFDTRAFSAAGRSKIRFIDHSQIVPAQYAPVFNSHAIEAHLHHIPGLSEVFLYMNDDMFLTCPYTRHHVFKGDMARAYAMKDMRLFFAHNNESSWWHCVWSARAALAQQTGFNLTLMWHAPQLLRKAALHKMWQLFPAQLDQTCRNRVRVQAPLGRGGDLALPLLAMYTSVAYGYQELDYGLSWTAMWNGRVEKSASVVKTRGWASTGQCRHRSLGKPAPFTNVQSVTNPEEAKKWCEIAAPEYASAWSSPDVAKCLCQRMPMGSACSL